MKLYYCHIEKIDISYLETINDLIKNLVDKLANKEIFMPFNYSES